jgi:hypothetical protein
MPLLVVTPTGCPPGAVLAVAVGSAPIPFEILDELVPTPATVVALPLAAVESPAWLCCVPTGNGDSDGDDSFFLCVPPTAPPTTAAIMTMAATTIVIFPFVVRKKGVRGTLAATYLSF